MAYQSISTGWRITSKSFVDRRIVLSKTEMRSVEPNSGHTQAIGTYDEEGLGMFAVENHFFCCCYDDGVMYSLDYENNSYDSDTGYFRPSAPTQGYRVTFNSTTSTISEVR